MFDLFRSRDKAVRYLVGGILGIVALSMVTYLIPSYTDQVGTSLNPVLVEVGADKITAADADALFRQTTSGKLPPEMMEVYFPQFLDRLTGIRAAMYEAKQLGIRATDDEVRAATMGAFSQFVQNGKLQRDALEAALAQQGKTLEAAIEEMRENVILGKLQKLIVDSVVVSPKEAEREFRKRFEKASVQYLAFAPTDLRSQVTISDEELKARYEQDKANFNKPEKFAFRVLVLDRAKLEAGIQLTDAELRAAYSGSLDNFRKPERVHARHILLSTDGKSDAEKAAQKAKAESLLKQARGGADFAALARANSEDGGNSQNGGDLGWYPRGQLDPAFDAVIFAAKPQQITDLVTTPFGYHVVQVLEKEPASVAPFETVRADIERDLRDQKILEQVQVAGDNMHAELVKNPTAIEEIAKKYNAEVVTVTEAASGDPIPTLGVTPEITSQLQILQPGGVSDLVALPGDRLATAVLQARIPGRPSTLDEVRTQIRESLLAEKAQKLATDRAQTAAERLRKGEDPETVAKALGAKLGTASNFGRGDNPEGLGSAVYLEDAFVKPAGTVLGPLSIDGRPVVAKVTGKTEADLSGFPPQQEQIMKELKANKQAERTELWLDGVLAKLTDEGKVVRHQDEIQRVMAQYHTQ